MVVSSSSEEETLLYNVKISSVGPGRMTRPGLMHEPTSINLAMKLHYLKGVYYFKSHEAFKGMTIKYIKETMFEWLNQFYVVCGRIRRSESGRPYIKCNDCGVRFTEAQCAKTIDEWLEMIMEDNDDYLKKMLIFGHPIGPELAFSPNVFIQLTKFKCGGISVALSWAHVLGDAYFASEFINMWGKVMGGNDPEAPPNSAQYRKIETSPKSSSRIHFLLNGLTRLEIIGLRLAKTKSTLVMNKAVDERQKIEETMESENGLSDVIVYGANLTFVDLEEAAFYDMRLMGQNPFQASYSVDGVGDEGVVLLLPTLKDGGRGRFVTITLPENELLDLKYEPKENDLLPTV